MELSRLLSESMPSIEDEVLGDDDDDKNEMEEYGKDSDSHSDVDEEHVSSESEGDKDWDESEDSEEHNVDLSGVMELEEELPSPEDQAENILMSEGRKESTEDVEDVEMIDKSIISYLFLQKEFCIMGLHYVGITLERKLLHATQPLTQNTYINMAPGYMAINRVPVTHWYYRDKRFFGSTSQYICSEWRRFFKLNNRMEVNIGNILTRHLSWFKEHLKDSTIPHLVHCHSAEMKAKSVIVWWKPLLYGRWNWYLQKTSKLRAFFEWFFLANNCFWRWI